MLASDEEGGTFDALRFSLASDIVELVVLTTDDAFLQTLREAVGGARRLWHVPSGEKVSDLLVAGGVGIIVLDVLALSESPSVFVGQIKRQFPDLVVVAAGNRDAETSLAGLISSGIVYRFIHKPMSPGRARLFAEAAVKKYTEQRRRAAATPVRRRKPRIPPGVVIGGTGCALGAIVLATWLTHRSTDNGEAAPRPAAARRPSAESPLLAHAATALAANRLTEPAGDNALELYLTAQAQNPADATARGGLAEVHERLLARAENALLEERLDEAAAAIETARKAGVESGRIAFLTAQLAKSREQVKTAQPAAHVRAEPKAGEDKAASWLNLAAQRIKDNRLVEPDGDNALFYVRQALSVDPANDAALEAEKELALKLLTEAHSAIDRRDFARASAWLDAAKGVAAAANIEAAQTSLAAARQQADADAWTSLLKNANDRLQQDRLIEPVNDSAKYYLMALQSADAGNAGLQPAMKELGARLVAKARRALVLGQHDAARSWLDEAAAIGFASAEATSARRDLDTAIAAQQFMTNVVPAGDLTVVKSVQPLYPKKAESKKVEGWIEMDFTVTESGTVKDIELHAVSTPGVFEEAAIAALSQWRFKPVQGEAVPKPQRARIRFRFAVAA